MSTTRVVLAPLVLTLAWVGCGSHDATPSERVHLAPPAKATTPKLAPTVHDVVVRTNSGEHQSLAAYRGKTLVIVNTASKCGYTPQYASLQKLYERYRDRGLEILAFPSNDFGGQEPGTDEEIERFCSTRYDVTFPLFAKTRVKGASKSDLYRLLTEQTPAGIRGEVRWNFTKFIVDPSGKPVTRFEPPVDPLSDEFVHAIEALVPSGG